MDEQFFDLHFNANVKGLFFSVQKGLPFMNHTAFATGRIGFASDIWRIRRLARRRLIPALYDLTCARLVTCVLPTLNKRVTLISIKIHEASAQSKRRNDKQERYYCDDPSDEV